MSTYMVTSSKETFSSPLALCSGNSPVSGEFPEQRPVTRNFYVFFDLCLNKQLSKQSWGLWFGMLWRSLWRHCNVQTYSACHPVHKNSESCICRHSLRQLETFCLPTTMVNLFIHDAIAGFLAVVVVVEQDLIKLAIVSLYECTQNNITLNYSVVSITNSPHKGQ